MRLRVFVCLPFAALLFSAAVVPAAIAHAEAMQTAAARPGVDDTWQGTLHAQKDLRTVVKITKAPDGSLKAQWYSIDQTPRAMPIKTTTFRDGELRLDVEDIDGVYTGKLSSDGNTITGEWKQGDKTFPLVLARSTKETAWAMPEPPKPVAPMALDANPTWEVATIKLAPPDEKGKGFGGPPRAFQTRNTTLNDLIMFAYDVNSKQIVGGPDVGPDRY